YNLTVEGDHVYRVSPQGLLVHNNGCDITLRHGTDSISAKDIVAHGLDVQRARELGGGDVFWTTKNASDADFFANANPALGKPAVVRIDIQPKVAESLKRQGLLSTEGDVFKFEAAAWPVLNEFGRFSIE
ncbi:MAG: hypothetical protein KDA60_22455, partial [Planctomycetales bacterium]|nr:hypothetical protein [Planctomycetales bacterium]